MDLSSWAVPQLSKLLPLDEDSLKQIITYSDSLSKDGAADNLKNLLGDSPQALEFIAAFNQRRKSAPSAPSTSAAQQNDGVPKAQPRNKKGKKNFNKLPPVRQVEGSGNSGSGYIKKEEEDYMAAKPKPKKEPPIANALALQDRPDALQLPLAESNIAAPQPQRPSKLPPSAHGPLISDSNKSSRNTSRDASRNASPAPKQKTKINISGGTAMHGQSTVINDLDDAIRSLEVQTNPSLQLSEKDNATRKCNCMATRHPLLDAAPNCLGCGKVICIKEGLGPCTFCGKRLLSSDEIQSMIQILREERGREKIQANNASQRRPEVSMDPKPFSSPKPSASPAPPSDEEAEKLEAAKRHRDKLLNFQSHNARRTQIHDEAADFDTPESGLNMWATPQERALQLKRQQKALREQEWNARPEYDKRNMVASIDLVGKKVMRRMAPVERPSEPETEEEEEPEELPRAPRSNGGPGAFSNNPLLGKLIKPVAKTGGKGKERTRDKETSWRRVQDDDDDNEQWILDGGAYGNRADATVEGSEEPACG